MDSFAYPRCRGVGGPARKKGSGVPGRAIVERCFERRPEALDQSDASATSWSGRAASPPAERWGDLGQDGLDDMRIVGDAKLVRDCEE
jgi:hypothetical protein